MAYLLLLSIACLLLVVFIRRRSWCGLLLMGAFLLRAILALILDTGLKYNFVLDSLAYEANAWLIAQRWRSITDFLPEPDASTGGRYYELFLAGIFYLFGKDPLLAVLMNCAIATLTIGLLYWFMCKVFLVHHNSTPALIMVFLLALYPADLIWSATNIRDPIYFFSFAAFSFTLWGGLSRHSHWRPLERIAGLIGAAIAVWMIAGLRTYISGILVGAMVLAFGAAWYLRYRSWQSLLIGGLSVVAIAISIVWISFPELAESSLSYIETTRLNFANLGMMDNVAASSFALDWKFTTPLSLIAFVPVALGHYFLGPFPWEIRNAMQAAAFIEALVVYVFLWPTLKGIRIAYQRRRSETVILLTFILTFALAQSLVISNMGTLFRHRTLTFLFLSIFTGLGCYEIWTKNRRTLR